MKIEYRIPATRDQGECVIVGKSGYMETARQNALWQYNSAREHDGQRPVKGFPKGTKSYRKSDNVENSVS